MQTFEFEGTPGHVKLDTTTLEPRDGATITGAWEYSADGREWSHDFTLTYIAVTAP